MFALLWTQGKQGSWKKTSLKEHQQLETAHAVVWSCSMLFQKQIWPLSENITKRACVLKTKTLKTVVLTFVNMTLIFASFVFLFRLVFLVRLYFFVHHSAKMHQCHHPKINLRIFECRSAHKNLLGFQSQSILKLFVPNIVTKLCKMQDLKICMYTT